MKEERGNIETWLKTAAQQPGPGIDRKDEEEGWAGLSAMLDDDDDVRPGIIAGSSGQRLRRNRWLSLTAIVLVTSVLLLISVRRLKDITRPSSSKAHTTAAAGETNNAARKDAGGGIVHQPAATPPEKPALHAERGIGATTSRISVPLATTNIREEPMLPPQLPALPVQETPDSRMKELNNRMVNGWSLQTIPLPASNGLTLSGPGPLKWPVPPSPGAAARYPRWAVQAGFVAGNDGGRGGRISLMYRLPVRQHFYLQPYIGAGYTGNYDRLLQHMGVVSTQNGSGLYRTDSIWTSYKMKSVLTADAGIRIGYTLHQFSFSTGIRYHHIVQSKGDSSVYRKPAPASGTIYSQTFSKADAPGRNSFYGELEAAYQWRFGWQTGISYQLLLHESASPSWQPPVVIVPGSGSSSTTIDALPPAIKNSLQDKGRLEIYLRIPLGKK